MKKTVSVVLAIIVIMTGLLSTAFAVDTYPVEAKYAAAGSHGVKTLTLDSGEADYSHYKIWYPADLETSEKTYPVILYNNATGCTYDTDQVPVMLAHYASWGFIVLANDHQNSGKGDSASKGLAKLLQMHTDPTSIFCGKVDQNAIGLNGHSQGGSATINAASEGAYENSAMFKSICAVSIPYPALAASFLQNTPYDASRVRIPAFLIAGTGAIDAGNGKDIGISPLDLSLVDNLKAIQNDTVFIGRMKNTDHMTTQPASTAYATAWFCWTLCGDSVAAGAFTGSNPELFRNEKWQDVYNKQSSNLPEASGSNDTGNKDDGDAGGFGAVIAGFFAKIAKLFAQIGEFFRRLFH